MADKSKWKGKNLSYMTPQMMHALKMSQTQSQNTYKKTYNEQVKGKGSSATETVESRRVKKLSTEQSLLNYHKDFENSKSKGYTATTETPELERIRKQSHRDVNYKKEYMEQKGHNIPVAETPDTVRVKNQQKFLSDIKYQEDREKLKGKATQVTDDPATRRAMNAAKIASDIQYKKGNERSEEMETKRQDVTNPSQTKAYKHVAAPGKIADYDPAKHMQRMSVKEKEPEISSASPPQTPEPVQDQSREPVQDQSNEPIQYQPPEPVQDQSPEPVQDQPPEPVQDQTPEPQTTQETVDNEQDQGFQEFLRKSDGHIYKAMYDYTAQDDDEVSFNDGDTVINAQRIDDGWMFGTIERTGQTGMLPSNYVQIAQ